MLPYILLPMGHNAQNFYCSFEEAENKTKETTLNRRMEGLTLCIDVCIGESPTRAWGFRPMLPVLVQSLPPGNGRRAI